MNKNILMIAGAILAVGIILSGVLFYNHQGDLNIKSQQLELEKQKEKAKQDATKKDEERAINESQRKSLQYTSCVSQADKTKDDDLKINSQYETTDPNGGVIYHGDAAIFARINATAQQEKTRCSSMYQN